MTIEYRHSAEGLSPHQLQGFFVGWPNPPSPEKHLELLQKSDEVILALDTESGNVVGFITAITDNVLAAYIPLLEVLPSHQKQQVGKALVEKMLARLHDYYMVDLLCDTDVQPFYEKFGMHHATGMVFRNYEKQSGR